jgi:hypothetical protein
MEDGEEPENWKPVTEFVKDRTRKTQKLKKIDSMRIENLRTTIVSQTKKYYRVQPVRIL